MGYNYEVLAAYYPFKGSYQEIEQFKTLRQAVRFIKKCQKRGLVIIDLRCRDFED